MDKLYKLPNDNSALKSYEHIILASQSPRRLEILRAHGIEPLVMPVDVDEEVANGTNLEDAVTMLSRKKALAALNLESVQPYFGTRTLLIASDTIVYTDELLGKPRDREDAYRMLSSYRQDAHYVATGVTLIDLELLVDYSKDGSNGGSNEVNNEVSGHSNDGSDGGSNEVNNGGYSNGGSSDGNYNGSGHRNAIISFCDVTKVFCKDYSDDDIYNYIDQEQPYDKAGSYAIQSCFSKHIDHIEGDYENVIGFPYYRLEREVSKLR